MPVSVNLHQQGHQSSRGKERQDDLKTLFTNCVGIEGRVRDIGGAADAINDVDDLGRIELCGLNKKYVPKEVGLQAMDNLDT